MDQKICGVDLSRDLQDLHPERYDGALHPELLGAQVTDSADPSAKQHALACTCIILELEIGQRAIEFLGELVDPDELGDAPVIWLWGLKN